MIELTGSVLVMSSAGYLLWQVGVKYPPKYHFDKRDYVAFAIFCIGSCLVAMS